MTRVMTEKVWKLVMKKPVLTMEMYYTHAYTKTHTHTHTDTLIQNKICLYGHCKNCFLLQKVPLSRSTLEDFFGGFCLGLLKVVN